jgi:hypothetical protein
LTVFGGFFEKREKRGFLTFLGFFDFWPFFDVFGGPNFDRFSTSFLG